MDAATLRDAMKVANVMANVRLVHVARNAKQAM
jgi:hypothetical protein